MLALVLIIAAFRFFHERNRKIYEYVEQQNEIQKMREDYGNRDPYEFLDTPGVRGAADNGYEQFRRDRDEILQRFRNRLAD
ncbi:hypothetical protein AGMMS49991_08170 [Spirochaetia bacterium]|nr:hypothetical protein AGMMS49991_08170 [Spirochaetia bacterium]